MFLGWLPVRQENHGIQISSVYLLSIVTLVLEAETILKRYPSNSQKPATKKRQRQERVPLQIAHRFKIKPIISQPIRAYLITKVSKMFEDRNRSWCVPSMGGQLALGILRQQLSSFTYRILKTINSCLQNLQAI